MTPAGLYIHIPFCKKKCGYCDFYSITTTNKIMNYIVALKKEIKLVSARYSDVTFDTIYLGGGTPTFLANEHIEDIWLHLQDNFKILNNSEITIEANPGTVNFEKLDRLRSLGFNRLSLGAQSFSNCALQFLERIHQVSDIYSAYQDARRAGFENINLDLITAYPGLTPAQYVKTLKTAIQLNPEHLSCYTLIFEPETPFFGKMKKGLLTPVSNEQETDFYTIADNLLGKAGYTAYEISNYARNIDLQCKHNLKYWHHQPYLGLGASAHSFILPKRWGNVRELSSYMSSLKNEKLPVSFLEVLDQKKVEFEYIFLHLRLKEGIDIEEYQKRFKSNFLHKYEKILKKLVNGGFIYKPKDRLLLTKKGWLLADEIASSF